MEWEDVSYRTTKKLDPIVPNGFGATVYVFRAGEFKIAAFRWEDDLHWHLTIPGLIEQHLLKSTDADRAKVEALNIFSVILHRALEPVNRILGIG